MTTQSNKYMFHSIYIFFFNIKYENVNNPCYGYQVCYALRIGLCIKLRYYDMIVQCIYGIVLSVKFTSTV